MNTSYRYLELMKQSNSKLEFLALKSPKKKNMIAAIILLPTAIVEEFSVDNNV